MLGGMTISDGVRRPVGVTVVVVLTYLSGVLSLLAGFATVLLSRSTAAQAQLGAGRGVILAAGILGIVLGVVTLVVAGGLRHGRRSARIIVTVVEVVRIAGSVGQLGGGSRSVSDIVQIVLAFAVLGLLWSGPAREFFRRS